MTRRARAVAFVHESRVNVGRRWQSTTRRWMTGRDSGGELSRCAEQLEGWKPPTNSACGKEGDRSLSGHDVTYAASTRKINNSQSSPKRSQAINSYSLLPCSVAPVTEPDRPTVAGWKKEVLGVSADVYKPSHCKVTNAEALRHRRPGRGSTVFLSRNKLAVFVIFTSWKRCAWKHLRMRMKRSLCADDRCSPRKHVFVQTTLFVFQWLLP